MRETFAYVGRRRTCGCVESVYLDIPGCELATAEWVAERIREGQVVTREPAPAGGFRVPAGCVCGGQGA